LKNLKAGALTEAKKINKKRETLVSLFLFLKY